jgi:2-isopropylmalate synthase
VTLVREGKSTTDAAIGDGPVDAVCEAIQRITGLKLPMTDYSLRAITSGKDALGEVTVEVEYKGRRFRTRGLSTDIIEASARAYLAAANRAMQASAADENKPQQP